MTVIILESLLSMQRHIADVLNCRRPPAYCSDLQPDQFLQILGDITAWSLSHLDSDSAYSLAEALTPIERTAGQFILAQRKLELRYLGNERRLEDIADPAIRGSALWFAHALLAAYHTDAPDRLPHASLRYDRQRARLHAAPPPALATLHSGMHAWPQPYLQHCWTGLNLPADAPPELVTTTTDGNDMNH